MKTLKKNNISQGSSINSPVTVNKNCDLPPFFNTDYFSHVVVQTLEELESIPCKLRQDGMVATVVQDGYSDYQLQTSRTGFGICDNNAWVKISIGDEVFNGGNLFLFQTEEQANEFMGSTQSKEGQIIYISDLDSYFKFDGQDGLTDAFPNKLDKPTVQGLDNPNYKIPAYLDGKPYWRSSSDFEKVKSVNSKTGDVVLKTSDLENDSDYTTNSKLNKEVQDRIAQINDVEQKIQTEKIERISGDNILDGKITVEEAERINADGLKLDKPLENATDQYVILGDGTTSPKSNFGKVDTIDGIEADENKDVKLGAVRKTESNEVTSDFDFHQENGAYVSVATDGVKVSKGGIYSLYKPDSIKPYNQSIGAAYQFQELLFPKRAVIGVEEKVYPITYLNGVKANENGRADIWGVANNWTNASQRFSGLVDKSTDVTFNSIIGSDSVGNLAKISQAANLLERTLAGTTSEQALRIGNLLNGGNGSSGAISVNLISPPLLQNTRNDIEYVLLRGVNLLLNNTDMSISICDKGKSVIQRIPNEQIINNSTTELLFYYNFYQFTPGTYYLKITSGVKTYFTTLDLQIVDEIENININAITWDINYKEGVIPKNTDSASGGHVSITTLGPVTELPIQSLKSSPLFSKDDDFYIEFTLELGSKYLHRDRYLYFSFIGLGDSSIPNTLFNNSFIYLKYSHSWDASNAIYNNNSRINNLDTPSKITVNVIKTKGICRMVIGSSNVNVIIPEMDYFSFFMAFTGNEYELLTQIKIIKAFKIK